MVDNNKGDINFKRLGQTLLDDLQRADLRGSLNHDWKDAKEFFLTDDQKLRLAAMHKIKKSFHMFFWILKALLLKLTTARRLLLAISILLVILSGNSEQPVTLILISAVILLFILLMELKDKLLAQDELEAGRQVQIALMPDRSPAVDGFDIWLLTLPANEVGGDLVDFIQLSDNRFGIVLSDIAGKGLKAALLTSKLQTIIRAFANEFESLEIFASKINEIFFKHSLPNIFASLIYLELNTADNEIKFFNAGHMPPLVIKDKKLTELKKGDPAIGIRSKLNFTENKIILDTNDLIFLYSDGLTEAVNLHGDFFGKGRLINLLDKSSNLKPVEIGERVLSEINYFTREARRHDDISIAIIKKK